MAALSFPADLRYRTSDEWLRVDGDTATIGISDYAQDQLNDVVYVELPAVGTQLTAGSVFGQVESVKAASDLYAPVGGEVVEINSALEASPEVINSDPYGAGWMIRVRVSGAPEADLLDAEGYRTSRA